MSQEPSNSSADASAPAAASNGSAAFVDLVSAEPLAVPLAELPADGWAPLPTGTAVRAGDLLAQTWPAGVCAPLAPIAGVVAGSARVPISHDAAVQAVLLAPANRDAPADQSTPAPAGDLHAMLRRVADLKLEKAIDELARHGVWANRWNTPDLLGQLQLCRERPIDTVLWDALDESPDLLLHHRLTVDYPLELTAGVLALAAITRAQRVWAVMAAYGEPRAWEAMRQAAAGTRLKLVAMEDHYPQSHPSLLIHALTGRHLRPSRLAAESGVLVVGAAAALAVGRCFLHQAPMLRVPIGLYDLARRRAHWLHAPVGTRWSAVLRALQIDASRVELRAGNPLRESRLSGDCVIGGGELAITAAPYERFVNPDPCIRCAWCVEGCPVAIQPAGLLEAAQQEDRRLAERYGLEACIECGICSYVCPSHLPLLTAIRGLKKLPKA